MNSNLPSFADLGERAGRIGRATATPNPSGRRARSVTFDHELDQKIVEAASADDRDFSSMLRILVREAFAVRAAKKDKQQ